MSVAVKSSELLSAFSIRSQLVESSSRRACTMNCLLPLPTTLRCDSAISLEDNIMVRRHLLAAEDKTRF